MKCWSWLQTTNKESLSRSLSQFSTVRSIVEFSKIRQFTAVSVHNLALFWMSATCLNYVNKSCWLVWNLNPTDVLLMLASWTGLDRNKIHRALRIQRRGGKSQGHHFFFSRGNARFIYRKWRKWIGGVYLNILRLHCTAGSELWEIPIS